MKSLHFFPLHLVVKLIFGDFHAHRREGFVAVVDGVLDADQMAHTVRAGLLDDALDLELVEKFYFRRLSKNTTAAEALIR